MKLKKGGRSRLAGMRDQQGNTTNRKKTVAIVGTLDTKGAEYKFLKEQIETSGVATLVIDVGILGTPLFTPGVAAAVVALAAGVDLQELGKESGGE